jgi:hypothetical protein
MSLLLIIALVLATVGGCTTPGAIAPSTIPLGEDWAPLSAREGISSCGYTFLTIPIKNPKPLSTLIDELTHTRGGNALIEVSSDSSVYFYLLGVANCLEVRGKIVKIAR